MLKIQGLKKKFGNFEALAGLDMEVAEGALYGFVGPNGAGKTTAIRIITGLLNADEGSVLIDGKDAFCYRDQVKDLFGYVPDEFGLYDNLKVWEYMDFFASCYGLSGLVARERCTNLRGQSFARNEAAALSGPRNDPRSEASDPGRADLRDGPESACGIQGALKGAVRGGKDDPCELPYPLGVGADVYRYRDH